MRRRGSGPMSSSHDCRPPGRKWDLDLDLGILVCRNCGQAKLCLQRGHNWVPSPQFELMGLWCERCHVADGLGVTAPPEVRAAYAH